MEILKKKNVKRIILAALALAVVVGAVALPFALDKNNDPETKASIRSARVEKGSIQKTISGAGTLTDQDAVELSLPDGVKLTEYLVSNGEFVNEGDAVAKVDRASVMETISTVRDSMDEIAGELSSASKGKYTDLTAPASGRVKAVYANKGDHVGSVTRDHGALAVLSLDGLMAAKLSTDALQAGQTVSVILSDGKEIDGKVEAATDGTAVVTISDRYGSIGETVGIKSEDGTSIGTAELYVHSEWKAMASTGTVQSILRSEGQTCSKGETIFSINQADDDSSELLLEEYRDDEETMAVLFRLYQNGTAQAPSDGCVSGVDDSLITKLSAQGGLSVVRLANAPGDAPDGSFLNRLGMVTAVNDDGTITVKMQMWDTQIDDYMNPGYLVTAAESMTVETTISKPPAYTLSGSEWVGAGVQPGDVFIFAYNANVLAWMVYAGHNELPPESDPEQPDQPGADDNKDDPGGGFGGKPDGGSMPVGGFTGGLPDMADEDTGRYSSKGTTILSVTPQETVNVSITIDELDILSLKVGQEVTITLDALTGQSFPGIITEVNTTASNDGGHSKYSATVQLDRTDKMLGGMNASARIVVEERDDVLLIPSEALNEIDGQPVVYTGYDDKTGEFIDPVNVEIGLSDGMQIQILSGLDEGSEIWYETYDKLEIEGLS